MSSPNFRRVRDRIDDRFGAGSMMIARIVARSVQERVSGCYSDLVRRGLCA